MPSILVELISGDVVESCRREAALDRKRGRGWSPAHTTPKSARGHLPQFWRPAVNLRSTPKNGHSRRFRGWLCTLSIEAHRDDRDIGKLPPWVQR